MHVKRTQLLSSKIVVVKIQPQPNGRLPVGHLTVEWKKKCGSPSDTGFPDAYILETKQYNTVKSIFRMPGLNGLS